MRDMGRSMLRLGAVMAAPLAISTRVFAGFDDQVRSVRPPAREGERLGYMAART
jgi:hypothetical protein